MHVLPEPALTTFDSVMKNPVRPIRPRGSAAPRAASSNMKPGDTIDWECEIQNDDQPQSDHVRRTRSTPGEMCNVFGLYGPTDGSPWYGANP